MSSTGQHSFAGTSRFVVEDLLGRGGMGEVYRVLDRKRGSRVALKLLTEASPTALFRFKHEFRALASISHPNLLPLYELASEGDQWFFTMKLIEGVSFSHHVRGQADLSDTMATSIPTMAPASTTAHSTVILRAEIGAYDGTAATHTKTCAAPKIPQSK